jgi:tetratricopeptide (TPR) repeat protein
MVSMRDRVLEADELFKLNQYSQSEEIYIEVIEKEPTYADVFYKLGLISHNKEDFNKAIEFFEKALGINPYYYEALMGISITYNHIGELDKGKEYFDRAMEIAKDSTKELDMVQKYRLANEHMKIADVYEDARIYEKSIIEYNLALELCPNFLDIREKLALAYISAEKLEDAEREFLFILARKPENTRVINFLALCYYKSDRMNEAKEKWEQVLQISPEDNFSKIYLSLIDKNMSGKIDK